MTSAFYEYMGAEDLKREIVGHSIASMNPFYGSITLDDGRRLEFEGTGWDDSWFTLELVKRNLTADPITNVVEEEVDSNEQVAWVLHILAGKTTLADLHVHGQFTQGDDNRCESISLTISSAPKG